MTQVGTPIALISTIFLSSCGNIGDLTDKMLFGATLDDQSANKACSSNVSISYRTISLLEDGDVTATFDESKDKLIAETDADGGTAWGYRSFETCIYPTATFTGTVKFSVASNGTYDGRITATRSFPGGVDGQPLPEELTFTGIGTANRQCFRFVSVDDGIRNSIEDPLIISLGTITELDGSGDVNSSGAYHGADVCDISVTMEDDNGPGIRVSNISTVMEEPGALPPNSATFTVVLRQAPTANVAVSINDTYDSVNAGNREGTTSPTTLTFTSGNWSTPQTVTVTSVDDLEVDGLKTYIIQLPPVSSTDAEYNGLDPRDVVVYNRDQSVPGYSFEKWDLTTQSTGTGGGTITGFATDEANQMASTYATVRIKLRSKPSANVTLNFATNCGSKCSLITSSLTFTPSNWNTYQTVQVQGSTDSANSGNADYNVTFTATSSDTTYSTTVSEPTIQVRSCDNDAAHLIHACNFSGQPFGTTGSRFSRQEANGTASIIWLIAQSSPASTINVGLSSSDTTEGTIGNAGSESVINSSNYNKMEASGTNRVIMNHVDDTFVDGSQNWEAQTAASTGAVTYDPMDVYATTTDNENYYYINVSGTTKENTPAQTATVSVCLGANNPDQAITINLACSGDECGSISVPSITFPINSQVSLANASNAGCPSDANKQTFTVTGADDVFADGTQTFSITMIKAATTDAGYAAAGNPSSPTISNQDNEPTAKAIFFTSGSYNGEMTAQGVLGADNTCNTTRPPYAPSGTYKALIVSNSGGEVNDRTPSSGWVINSSYYYYRCTGAGAACSDENQHLFAGGSFNPLSMTDHGSNPIYFPSGEYWTGLTAAASPVPATQASTPSMVSCTDGATVYRHNCHGFTYQTCPTDGAVQFYGQTWNSNGAGTLTDQEQMCTNSYKLICVQQ
ncbi:MAG: hypothetical protein F9K24_06760 [Leptonema illini]|uniref:DUF1554 domain-containing protein n=1 Tax=Leptonema illini TaxID=183 RepID=A0A833H389_9LEPT|nr:MAG: hypothetical protein F9K24_06760 [Leptonema illini]PKL34597.1 MAG: hypothetical protein CVV45_02370 [Spirochaetae bacterium HGW-Spirochaetae-10]